MQPFSLRSACFAALLCGTLLLLVGCRGGDTFNMSAHSADWKAAKADARQELSGLPLPLKSTYLSITQATQWQNPFLTVESNMIQIRIYFTDANSSDIDRGGMTRLSVARKHVLNIRLKDLPRALAALPNEAWPYGRVVAIGQETEYPRNRPRVRANVSVTIAALKDMGVVVDDWTQPRL